MKVGYSTLLGEYISAAEIGPDDPANLHIVCPACRNLIYKDVRTNGSNTTHFFAHGQIPAEWREECEARVRNISSDTIASTNHHARQDTLEMFRIELTEALEMMPIGGVIRSATISLLGAEPTRLWIENFVRHSTATGLQQFVARNDSLIKRSGFVTETTFADGFKSRIAAELMRTIIAQESPHILDYMIARSFCTVFSSKGTHRVATGRARKLQLALDREGEVSPTVFHHWSMLDAMMRELHRIPYLKMLANERDFLRPLEGLTIDDFIADRELEAGVLDDEVTGADGQRTPFSLTVEVGDGPIRWFRDQADDRITMSLIDTLNEAPA